MQYEVIQYRLATFGGNYDIIHATIANYWNYSFRQFPALLLNNFTMDEEQNIIPNDLISANFTNLPEILDLTKIFARPSLLLLSAKYC